MGDGQQVYLERHMTARCALSRVSHATRSVVEVSIEKYEKTTMQWHRNRTKTIDNNGKRKIQDKAPVDLQEERVVSRLF
jgi:hypothetical protein